MQTKNQKVQDNKQQDNSARRRRYCVDRKVQGALTRRMVYQWFVFLFVVSLALPLFKDADARLASLAMNQPRASA